MEGVRTLLEGRDISLNGTFTYHGHCLGEYTAYRSLFLVPTASLSRPHSAPLPPSHTAYLSPTHLMCCLP